MIFETSLKMNSRTSTNFLFIINAWFLFLDIVFASNNCFEYIKCGPNNHCGCGKKINDKKFHSFHDNARIINAKPSMDHKYPWMAQVQRYALQLNGQGAFTDSFGGGAIISFNSILTAGHNICVNDMNREKGQDAELTTCPIKNPSMRPQEWDIVRNSNLNNNHNNKLTFRVGTNIAEPEITPHFNDKVAAYLYNYEPHNFVFSRNGDIGLLLVDGGIPGITQPTASPICEPTLQNFGEKIEVNFAGWGHQYTQVYSSNMVDVTKTSCQTNEANIPDFSQLSSSPSFDERFQFWDCQIQKAPKKFCNNWLLDQRIETLSIKTDLTNIDPANVLTDVEKKIKLRNMVDHKRCEQFMEKARKAWIKENKPEKDFVETIDRIVIEGDSDSEKNEPEICYNLKKVAKYGYCMTNERQPRHWGFCSRSCEYFPRPEPDNSNYRVDSFYEEGKFMYFEENPFPRSEIPDWWNDDHMKATFKCIGSIIPRAKNAFFKMTNNGDNLVYDDGRDDVPRPEGEYGYIGFAGGDSGCPYFYEENDQSHLIAIHSLGFEPQGFQTNDPTLICPGVATKITNDIMDWTDNWIGLD